MDTRDVVAVTVTPGAAEAVPGLTAALDGSGPAVLPLPPGAEGVRLRAALGGAAARGVPVDTAVILATSGSTGLPKGVRISAAALEFSARATHEHLGGPGQWLAPMSAARVAGLQSLVRARLAGFPALVLDTAAGLDPAAFAAAIDRLDPRARRYTSLVPTALIRLLDAGVPLGAFDAILLGGGPIPAGLVERARAAGARVVRSYGMTESCGGCVYDGRPLPGVDIAITGDGLIRIAGPVLALGYLDAGADPAGSDSAGSDSAGSDSAGGAPGVGAPGGGDPAGGSSSARVGGAGGRFVDGAFVSSDLGRLDGGVLTVLGRADDVIVTGGVNVPAQAVEAVLAGHPAVAAVAVVGRPDQEWGEAVVAVLVPAPGAAIDAAALRALVAGRLGRFHAPRAVLEVDALPVLPSGKVDRAAVRALAARSREVPPAAHA